MDNYDVTDIRFWIGLAQEDLHHCGLEEFGYSDDPYAFPGDETVDLAYRLKAGYEAGKVYYHPEDAHSFDVDDLPAPWTFLKEQQQGFKVGMYLGLV